MINTRFLTKEAKHEVFFVFKLSGEGFQNELNFLVNYFVGSNAFVVGADSINSCSTYLLNTLNTIDIQSRPDGWLEVLMGEFTPSLVDTLVEFIVNDYYMEEHPEGFGWFHVLLQNPPPPPYTGLIILGMEVRQA